ncbi:MAG: acetate kinase [Pseudomonadota bacterium]|jgi:acetate kinase
MNQPLPALLCLNAGSSSVKFSLYRVGSDAPELLFGGQIEGLLTQPTFQAKDAQGNTLNERYWDQPKRRAEAVEIILDYVQTEAKGYKLAAVGHRVVLGGTEYPHSVIVDDAVLNVLEHYAPIVPSHQPAEIEAIRSLQSTHPDLKQVACFDSAFHRTKSEVADLYALPLSYRDKGIQRWGFHGLSYDYISTQLPMLSPRLATGKTVVMHLGSGASLCGLDAGKSVYTSMGFSPLDGLMMGTRCGSLDPMIPIYLMDQYKMTPAAIEKLLIKESGLLGVSGISNDMRDLDASKDKQAQLAIDLFVYMLAQQTGTAMASIQGLDGIVFTAGIGERSPLIRAKACAALGWAGVVIDPVLNESKSHVARRISTEQSQIEVWVIPTDEESVIARDTWRLAKS